MNDPQIERLLDAVAWNAQGLVPAIAQAEGSGDVLMLAWMDRVALAATLREGKAHYWSRSRSKLWKKGETSGNEQLVRDIRLDCDGDTVLLVVEQIGGIACHTGRRSCFFNRADDAGWRSVDEVIKAPEAIYGRE